MAVLLYSEQQAIKAISENNEYLFEQLEKDVVEMYLSKMLGVQLSQDVQDNPENYTDLLDGCTFEYCGKIVKHKGIKFCLAYYIFAEYIQVSDVQDTFSGMVQFNRGETTHISQGKINNIRANNISIAEQNWQLTKYYLDTVKPIGWCGQISKPYTSRIYEIKK